jgi:flagellar basal body-associated protein FliL
MDYPGLLNMNKTGHREQGSVLLIALIIVAVVSILSGVILYMLKVSMVQNQAIENYNNARNAAFLSLKNGSYELTGSDRLQQRPVKDLVEVLKTLGADISYKNK